MPIYRPFKDGPFQMTMGKIIFQILLLILFFFVLLFLIPNVGLRSLDINQWIEIDSNYRQHIQLKQNSSRRSDLFMCKDYLYDASMEILKMLIEHLSFRYPNMFQCNNSKAKIINFNY